MKDKPLTKDELHALHFQHTEGVIDDSQLDAFIENPFVARQWLDSENEPDLADEQE